MLELHLEPSLVEPDKGVYVEEPREHNYVEDHLEGAIYRAPSWGGSEAKFMPKGHLTQDSEPFFLYPIGVYELLINAPTPVSPPSPHTLRCTFLGERNLCPKVKIKDNLGLESHLLCVARSHL